jgi:succinyl-CoA synthetase alpha subunit
VAILIDETSRVVIAGITGREGSFHAARMVEFGTNVVAGVTPGKGGQPVDAAGRSVPVFDTTAEAVAATGADVACVFVPAPGAADAVLEAADAGIELVVLTTEHVPTLDMLKVARRLEESGTRLIGGNCPGLTSPGKCKVGIMPADDWLAGPVGVVSRSGTLTYEVAEGLTRAGLGMTTVIGIGGDPIIGTTFIDVLPLFEADPDTKAVVLLGEIGGADEERAAEYARAMKKPVVAFIGGRTAPKGKRMGHAGAIISGNVGTAESKIRAFEAARIPVADTLSEVVELIGKALA